MEEQGQSKLLVVTIRQWIPIQNPLDKILTTDTLRFRPIAIAYTRDVTRATDNAVLVRNLAISGARCIRIPERSL